MLYALTYFTNENLYIKAAFGIPSSLYDYYLSNICPWECMQGMSFIIDFFDIWVSNILIIVTQVSTSQKFDMCGAELYTSKTAVQSYLLQWSK